MIESDFLEKIKEALELDTSLVMDDMFKESEYWDSMTFLSLMVLLRDEYGVSLDIDAFNQINTWRDIYRLIKI